MIQKIGTITFDYDEVTGKTKVYEDGVLWDDRKTLRTRGTFNGHLSNIETLGLQRSADGSNAVTVFLQGRQSKAGGFYLTDDGLQRLVLSTKWNLLAPYVESESQYDYLTMIVLDNFHRIYERKDNRKVTK